MLHKMQSQWQQALMQGGTGVDIHPAFIKNFAIYRSNVVTSLTEVLQNVYPVTRQLVGDETFAALAQRYISLYPPQQSVLALYGDRLPAFIAASPLHAQLPYLAGVAQIEWARLQALESEIVTPYALADFAARVADDATLVLQPHVQLWRDTYDAPSIWLAHQQDVPDFSAVNTGQGDFAAIIFRQERTVAVLAIAPTLYDFLTQLHVTKNYLTAIEQSEGLDIGLLQQQLANWFAHALFVKPQE